MSKLACEAAHIWVESTRLKHTSTIAQAKRLCSEFSTLPGSVFSVHVIFFFSFFFLPRPPPFVVLNASLACILVRILSNANLFHVWVVNKKRSIIVAQAAIAKRWRRTCVTFLPSLATDGGHWTIWHHVSIVSILLCEIKYCYRGLWWMERVSQISVMSTLRHFQNGLIKNF